MPAMTFWFLLALLGHTCEQEVFRVWYECHVRVLAGLEVCETQREHALNACSRMRAGPLAGCLSGPEPGEVTWSPHPWPCHTVQTCQRWSCEIDQWCGVLPACRQHDWDRDGDVDLMDFAAWTARWSWVPPAVITEDP
jgi:hypothetical protein